MDCVCSLVFAQRANHAYFRLIGSVRACWVIDWSSFEFATTFLPISVPFASSKLFSFFPSFFLLLLSNEALLRLC